jgi:PST family polysaccharide transporter
VVSLAEIPLVLPALLLRASLPILTQQSVLDPGLRDRTLSTLMRTGFYFHVLIAAVLALLAEPIVVALYGEPFRPAASAFRIQVLSAPFVALGVLSSAWLVLQGCTGHALRRTLMGAVINIALNYFMIPQFGIAGAAAATLAAQFVATYASDAFYVQTRELFLMKTRALLPTIGGNP